MPTSNKASTNTMRKYLASLRMCMENLTWKKFAPIMSFPGRCEKKEEEEIERALKMFMLSGIFFTVQSGK